MSEIETAPIIFINFNRPNKTIKSLAAIRNARPAKIFLYADGPRAGNEDDIRKCSEVREILQSEIDWPCEIHQFFPEHNLGCGQGVATAISQAFSHFDRAIIVEDDCVGSPSFFYFCSAMLARYSSNASIGAINGVNFQNGIRRGEGDYYFSSYFHCWGWATWKNVWEKYEFELTDVANGHLRQRFPKLIKSKHEVVYWERIFEKQASSTPLDTWDYQFTHLLWRENLKCITPNINLVENIGFDIFATHTKADPGFNLLAKDFQPESLLSSELIKGPNDDVVDVLADQFTYWNVFAPITPNIKAVLATHFRNLIDYQTTGELDLALQASSELKALGAIPGVDAARGDLFRQQGKPIDAIQAYREELRWFPENTYAKGQLEALDRPLSSSKIKDQEFFSIYTICRPYTMLSEDRLYALYRNTRNICESGDSGDFVECGVAGGGSVLLIALVIKKYSRIPRIVYAFDTFEGMPSPSVEDQSIDGISAADSNWGEGTCAAPTEFVTSILEQFGVDDVVNLRKGLFADTLPVFAQSAPSIVLLHMDGDWYRSTYDILENLFDTLKPNSYVQIDDYGHWLGCRRAVDDFFSRRGWKPDLRLIDYTGRYFFSPANKAMGASVSCEKVLVNIGCGGSHSEKWRNFDLHPTSSNVEKFDIRSGIPLPATSADFVYSSHFIEHLSRQDASFFLRECSRVLRDGGLIRVVIPNLEDIVREYLRCFDGAMAGDQNDILKYEWIIHELLDQLTRHRSGGEMIRYLTTMPDSMRNYVENRVGLWIKNVQRQSVIPEDPADAEQVGRFRLSGEVHRWMYDRYSITKLLKEHGFSEVQVLDFATSQLPDFNTYKLDTIDSLRPRKPDSIYIEAKKVAPRVDPTAGITINERNVSPSSFCTIATRGASLDLQALLASLSMHMPGSRIYVFADSYVANHYDQMPFDLRLDIKWNICLDPYSNLNRGIMEKTGIWSDFQMMKGKVINYALSRKESDVMFLDADIFLTAPIVLSGYSDQVAAVSRHHIMKDLEDQYGIYNGGVLWARRKEVVDFWMSRFSSSRYYDQACLEDVFERFDCLVMGEHQNISPYRLFDAQENYKLIMKKFSYRDNALYFKSKAVEFIHTHLSWREPRNFLAFNSFILNLFKNNKDDPNYRMLEYFTSISN